MARKNASKAFNRKEGRNLRQTRKNVIQPDLEPSMGMIVQKRNPEPLKPINEAQKRYINAIRNFQITFGIGSAGSGKTYIAGAIACEMLEKGEIDKIIITRPAVEAGESLGFLPGELEEKYEPYLAAFRDVLNDRLGKSYVDYLIKIGRIEAIPLAYMRGRTLSHCVAVLDEAQNCSKKQFQLFLTRIGENCKVIIDGDESQTDIPHSGLVDAINRISYIPSVKVVRFTRKDVIRSSIVSEIVQAYEEEKPFSKEIREY